MIEAQLNGIPVVGSAVGGLGQTIGGGGVVVERTSVEGFTQAVQQSLEPARRAELSAAARENASLPEFAPDQQFEILRRFLHEIVDTQ